MPRDAPVTMHTFPAKEGSSEDMLDESLNQKIANYAAGLFGTRRLSSTASKSGTWYSVPTEPQNDEIEITKRVYRKLRIGEILQ